MDYAALCEEFPRLLLCPQCDSDNPETRSYCWPCGALLRPALTPRPAPLPPNWRQRLYQRRHERPRLWHRDRRWYLLASVGLPVCFVVGVSAGWTGGAVREAIPRVQDRFSDQVAVAPDEAKTSSEETGFEAGNAADGVDNRAWAPKSRGQDAVGHSWTATFQQSFRLTTLIVLNGASKNPKQYLESGRPTELTAVVVTADGRTVQKELTLDDQPGPQEFTWGIDAVKSVDLRISGVHAGKRPAAPVLLAEVQFFTRQAR
ncbi:zinc ribbon domain-containing protein [Streptomyces sp. H27-D2]|nr:zinc ribbon domain-containing protein [Streptomyces sp. H27-D2]